MLNEYLITTSTIMVKSLDNSNSMVYDFSGEYVSKMDINTIIESSCSFYGSSYEGRIKWSKEILNTKIKLPVVIEESKNIIFFPTRSISNNDCIWLSYNNITRIEKNGNATNVFFNDNRVYSIDVSYDIIDRQIYNCLRLEKILLSRRNNA